MSYIDTWKEVVFSPDRFFREMPKKGGYADPIVFTAMNTLVAGLLTSTVGRVFDPRLDIIWEEGNVSFLSFLLSLVIGVILSHKARRPLPQERSERGGMAPLVNP